MVTVLAKEQGNGLGSRAEEFRNDAFGNVIRRRTKSTAGLINDVPFVNQYSPIGELMNSFALVSTPPGQYERQDELKQQFAGGGQLVRQDQLVRDPNTNTVTLHAAGRHYYGADDRLMAVQRYSYRSTSVRDGTWEEYWYDALGRRVLTRARRDSSGAYPATTSGLLCIGTNICRSYKERVSWDGDQALVEDRAAEGVSDVSNNGVVRNIHGLVLDEPIALVADNTRIINYNWRGQGMSSVFLDGQAGDLSLGNTATSVDWPAATQAETYFAPSPDAVPSSNPKRWLGTFVANGQGTTGMLYRRNRYFDPKSGQFTQADPTGIATGMNVFGFAAGDPVNFSDPFGLCPWCIGAGAGAVLGGGGTVFYNYLHDLPLTSNLLRNSLIGAAAGATLGIGFQYLGMATAGSAAAAAPQNQQITRHAGFVAEMAKRTPREIARAVKSLERVASQHSEWVQNPTLKVPDFFNRSSAEQASLLRQWSNTIIDRTQQATLLKDLLK